MSSSTQNAESADELPSAICASSTIWRRGSKPVVYISAMSIGFTEFTKLKKSLPISR